MRCPLLLVRRLLRGGGERVGAPPLSPNPERPPKRDETFIQAARSLEDEAVIQSYDFKAKIVKADREGSHPDIVAFYVRFQRELERRRVPMFAFEFYRSPERQLRLLKAGATRAKPGASAHNHGMAVDVVHATRFWDLERKEWDLIGAIGKEVARKAHLKVTWGGDWAFYDPAHWELSDWRERVAALESKDAGEF